MYRFLLVVLYAAFFVGARCWSSVQESEVNALHSLYLATNGDSWIYNVGEQAIEDGGRPWNFSLPAERTDPCIDMWFGVKCTLSAEECLNQTCSIVQLHMSSFNMQGYNDALYCFSNYLAGTLPQALTNLTNLKRLSLPANKLSGTLPRLSSALSKLYYINYAHNLFTGTIPESYTRLLVLQRFDADNNYITGTIPPSFGNMSALSIFHLHDNLLSGSYPEQLSASSRLRYVEIMRNELWGSLPTVFGERYRYFKISQNMISGGVPSSLLRHSSLSLLHLHDNLMSGSISPLLTANQLESLHLEDNLLSGTVPSAVSLYKDLQVLQLSHNLLSNLASDFAPPNDDFYMLDLSNNRLTGTLPTSLLVAERLKFAYLHSNKFSGKIPDNLVAHAKLIEQVTLYNNEFSGTVPASLGTCSKLTTLLIQNNRLTGRIGDIFRKNDEFSLSPFPLLQLLDISSNRFVGTIPIEIFALPNIRHVAIIDNCFTGSIPEEICHAGLLEGLLLEGLRSGEMCRNTVWDPAGLTNTYFTTGIVGSIPPCIFSLPNLNILHITGNRLSGTIPSSLFMPNLTDLKLSDNRLSGYIPRFLQEQFVASIDLSRNRFKGGFDLFSRPNVRTTSLKLSVNRLSGHVAHGFGDIEDVDVLKGNLFECESREDIPSHDPDSKTYVCGSDQFDAPLTLLGILVGIVVFFACIAIGVLCIPGDHDLCRSLRYLAEVVRSFQSHISVWLEALSHPQIMFLYEFSKFIETLKRLRYAGVVISSIIVLCFGTMYFSFKTYGEYGSHVHQYRWAFTAAYLTGLLPALLMLSTLAALLFLAIRFTYIETNKMISEPQTLSRENTDYSSTPNAHNHSHRFEIKSYVYVVCTSLVNVVIILFVKGAYVYLLIWQEMSYKTQIAANIAFSVFDVMWNTVVVAKAVSLFSSLVRNKTRIRWHLLLLLFNNIVAPMLSAACTDRNCFVEIFIGRDAIVSKSQYLACSDTTENVCSDLDIVELSSTFAPAFTYSYQCMSSILTNFIPIFMFSYILMGFVIPCALIAFLWLLPFSWSNTLVARTFIPHVFFPGVHCPGVDATEKLIRPGIIMSNFLNHFAVMLTFGVASPLLALCVAWTIFVMTWMWQLVLGRFVHCYFDLRASAVSDKDTVVLKHSCSTNDNSNILKSLNFLCSGMWQGPVKAIWVIVDYSVLFFICLSVDIVGDVRGWLFDVLFVGVPAVSMMIGLRCVFHTGFRCGFHIFAPCRREKKEKDVSLVRLTASPIFRTTHTSFDCDDDLL